MLERAICKGTITNYGLFGHCVIVDEHSGISVTVLEKDREVELIAG